MWDVDSSSINLTNTRFNVYYCGYVISLGYKLNVSGSKSKIQCTKTRKVAEDK